MRNTGGIIAFITVMLTIICGGFAYFYIQFLPSPKKAIKCTNEWSTISFMVNEEKRTVVMAGEMLDPNSISIFNETAIAATWKHKNGATKIFLDRIAGALEVETTEGGSEWEKNKFSCSHSSVRF